MKSCEHFQALLLEHLYGLLDSSDARPLQEHLQGCPACQAEQARAQAQQQMLATAARADFGGVRFEVPRPASVRLPEPAAVGAPAPRSSLVAWAVAAGILLALVGAGVGGGYCIRYWERERQVALASTRHDQLIAEARDRARTHEDEINQARQFQAESLRKHQELQVQRNEKLLEADRAVREKQLVMVIQGPETIQLGAPNEYKIATVNLNGSPVPARLEARVLDQQNKVVYEEKAIQSQGQHKLTLPQNLPLKPGTELALEVVATGRNGPQGQLREKLTLAGSVWVTHLATDKPMYQPGEKVRFRSLTLDRASLKPASEELHLVFKLIHPSGKEEMVLQGSSQLAFARDRARPGVGPDGKPIRGIGAGEFSIPEEAAGGEYTLVVSEAADRFPAERRKFIVNRYQPPRLLKKVDFTRKSYGPGDMVLAECRVTTAGGKDTPLVGKPVTATVLIDGKTYDANGVEKPNARITAQTDATGSATIRFKLPPAMERGEASLGLEFRDDGYVEPMSRPIPIVLKKLQVEFFPEGGDLVAGVSNRVYFQVRSMLGKPAELKGRILDDAGQTVAAVETLNDDKEPGISQGMGSFSFTPVAGKRYRLAIDTPVGIEEIIGAASKEGKFLPEVKSTGVALSVPSEVTAGSDSIRVIVHSQGKDRQLLVGAYCRGRLLDHQRVAAPMGKAIEVLLRPESGVGGVCRVTAFEEIAGSQNRQHLIPLAERLVYRRPLEQLHLTVKPSKKQYVPGDEVSLDLAATTEKGLPAGAVLLVGVVDKSVITLADEKTARTMPTHFLLTSEVRRPEDLEYADVLLGPHPRAAAALDLLLGTQGWRRFIESDPARFRNLPAKDRQREEDLRYQADVDRLLVTIGKMWPDQAERQQAIDSFQLERQRVLDEFQTLLEREEERYMKASRELAALTAREEVFRSEQKELRDDIAEAHQAYLAALHRLQAYEDFNQKLRTGVLPAASLVLLLLAVGALVLGVIRGLARAVPCFATGTACVALSAILLLVAFGLEGPTAQRISMAQAPGTMQPPEKEIVGWAGRMEAKALEEGDLPFDRLPPAMIAQPDNLPAPGGMAGNAPAPRDGRAHVGDAKGAKDDRADQQFRKMNNQDKEVFDRLARQNLAQGEAKVKNFLGPQRRAGLADEAKRDKARDMAPAGKAAPPGRPLGEMAARMPFGQRMPAAPMMPPGGGFPLRGEQAMMGGRRGAGYLRKAAEFEAVAPCVVREYAHQRITGPNPHERTDFTETIFWHPVVVLPEGNGQVSFQMCDSVTTFQVLACGHTLDGRLGSVTAELPSRKAFTVDAKLPIEVTSSDRIDVPVALVNNSGEQRHVSVQVKPSNLKLVEGSAEERLSLGPNRGARRIFTFQPTIREGKASLTLDGKSEPPAKDDFQWPLVVVPEGFPVVESRSDMLEGICRTELVLPKEWVQGTLKCQAQVYPSTLADLQKGLAALLREPNGCFEQTSSSNYPNLLILDYLKESEQADPEIARKAKEMLGRGYQRLVAYECLNTGKNLREGYEWFGGTAPAHQALTAYGLLQFRDMARVHDVDPVMVERTRNYLLNQKDGKGGFARNTRALDTFGRAPDNITNAYIVWALTEGSKDDDVARELTALVQQADTSADPYFLALVANSLLNRGQSAKGVELLQKIVKAQTKEGVVDGARTSVTSSSGRTLQIETTALAILGWLKASRPDLFNLPTQAAIRWLGTQRGGYGGFGSTQSTILALKALIQFTRANKTTASPGEMTLFINEQEVGRLAFPAGAQQALTIEVPETKIGVLKPGANDVRVEVTSKDPGAKNHFPCTVTWSYNTLKPLASDKCAVALTTSLDRTEAVEGETVRLTAAVKNRSGQGQGMTLAILGLPAGLTLPENFEQLRDYCRLRNNGTEPGLISYFEVRGRELILYWRDLAPDKKIEVQLDLLCRVPGVYRGPASRAYLYYNPDHKHWVDPLQVSIRPRAD